ncbi:MAG: hypothetical protein K0R98_1711 [Rickettsiaceae bacterium]|jgi:mRNA interferase MazF|nr:hypothetical protein [Rickettsiaceae bacterium]
MQKDFDSWNNLKKASNLRESGVPFKEREVWWCRLGVNVGDEEDGKGQFFLRPVLIIRKFNSRLFIGLPFSTAIKEHNYFYYKFEFKGREQSVILSQIRLLDSKRLWNKMGSVGKEEFNNIKEKAKELIFQN